MKTTKQILLILGFLMMTGSLLAQKKETKLIRDGNREFSNGQYDNSEILYRKALEEAKSPHRANFNIGDALYKQEKYDEALNQFENLSKEDLDKITRGWTYHNIGNTHLQNQKLEESIEAYKEALRNNPDDLETKYNLAWAQDKLKQQQQQQEQQQQQNQDQQDKDQDQDEDQQNQDQQDQDDEGDNQEQQQQPQPNQISKEDAQRILQALQAQENEVQDKVKKAKAQKARVKTVIDW